MNWSMSSTTYMRRSIPNTNTIDIDINDSSDEEVSESFITSFSFH